MGHRHSHALPATPKNESDPPERHRHNFTIQITLDEMGKARQVVMNHVQRETEKKWSAWKPDELIDFIVLHAGVQASQEIVEPSSQDLVNAIAEPLPGVPAVSEQVPLHPVVDDLIGELHLRNLEIMSFDVNCPANVLRQGQPYTLCLTMDLTDIFAPNDVALASRAIIIAKQPGKPRLVAGEGRKIINLSDRSATVNVPGGDLPPGIYRLEAQVTLTLDKANPKHHQPTLAASLKGGLLEVN